MKCKIKFITEYKNFAVYSIYTSIACLTCQKLILNEFIISISIEAKVRVCSNKPKRN